MHNKLIFKIYFVIIPFLIVGISLGYTTFLMSFVALIPLFLIANRHTLAIYLVLYGGPLGGVIRAMYPYVPIYGLFLVLIGLFLMKDLVLSIFTKHIKVFWGILVTLIMFSAFYFIGPRDTFSLNKYTSMISHGIFMVIGYFAFYRLKLIDARVLSQLLFITAICMFTYVIEVIHLRPQGLFDYNWFRDQLVNNYTLAGEKTTILNYQQIGMTSLFGLAIFLSQIRFTRWLMLLNLVCGSQLILVSGCRQAIVGVVVIIALRMSVFRLSNVNNKAIIKKILMIVASVFVAYFLLFFIVQNLNSASMSNTLQEGDTIRERLFDTAFIIFMNNPLFGVGLGGYHYLTGSVYPHNFFLELLCETGAIGLIVSMFLLFIPLLRSKQGLLSINVSNQFIFLIVFGTLIRVMVSSDLTESIELFSAVYAITYSK